MDVTKDVTISALFESDGVTMKFEVATAGMGAADVEVVDVTGDGVTDELDCSLTGVDVGVELAVDGGGVELEWVVGCGKESGVKDGVDIVVETGAVDCQYSSCRRLRKCLPVELEGIIGKYHREAGIGCDATCQMEGGIIKCQRMSVRLNGFEEENGLALDL